jgi:WD40 repeat protein
MTGAEARAMFQQHRGFQRSIAVVIGINAYQNGVSSLTTATNDAKELARILQEVYQYDVIQILDEQASLENLWRVLSDTLPNTIKPTQSDRLLFYFAGHGIALNSDKGDGPAGYLLPKDAQPEKRETFLPMQEVHDALTALDFRHALMILDCCFAGAFRWSTTRDIAIVPEVLHRESYERFITDPAWQVITSAAYNQKALDILGDNRGTSQTDQQHSPFAQALLQGQSDLIADNIITATELYLYLRDLVEMRSNEKQTPGLWCLRKHQKGEYIFLLPGYNTDDLPPAPELNKASNPYRGLEPFEEKHCDLFFGRTALTQKLSGFVASHPLTVVLGTSGSGKSSLVKAGLLAKFRNMREPSSWLALAPFRPGELPFRALNKALAELHISDSTLNPAQKIADWFKRNPQSNLLLVVDQFEELVTLCRNDQESQQFLSELAVSIAAYPDQLRVLLTLRSDFEPQFRNTALESYWQASRFVVPAMSREELRQAIEEPASARVMYFNPPELVDQLIDEVAQMPGALPLLSFALSELYLNYLQRQTSAQNQGTTLDRCIIQADYEKLGGVTRSLTQRADQEYLQFAQKDSTYAQTVFNVMLRMVVIEGELARRRVLRSELEYSEPENTRVLSVIEHFCAIRLLTTGDDVNGNPYVEPAHDALVRGWQRLLDWQKTERENLILQRQLTAASEEWSSLQNKSFLWHTNPRLALLVSLLQSRSSWFNKKETQFVQKSEQRRKQKRRLSFTITGIAIATLSAATVIAHLQYRQARKLAIEAIIQSSEAKAFSHEDLEASMLAVKAAKQLQALPEAVDLKDKVLHALQRTMYSVQERDRLHGHDGRIRSVAFSPDNQQLVTASEDSKVILWDVLGQKEPIVLADHAGTVLRATFSLDNQFIASADYNGTIRLWDRLSNNHKLDPLLKHKSPIFSLAFSPDSKLLAAGLESGDVEVWDVSSKKKLYLLPGRNGTVFDLAFSSDGKTLATVSGGGTTRLWNIPKQQPTDLSSPYQKKNLLYGVAFSPDNKHLAIASAKGMIQLWDVSTTSLVSEFVEHGSGDAIKKIRSITFSPDGKLLATSGGDGIVRLWDIKQEKIIAQLRGHQGEVYKVVFASDHDAVGRQIVAQTCGSGYLLATSGADWSVRLWCTLGSREMTPLDNTAPPKQKTLFHRVFSQGADRLISVSEDSIVQQSYIQRSQLQDSHPIVTPVTTRSNSITSAAFNPVKNLLALSFKDGTVELWTLANETPMKIESFSAEPTTEFPPSMTFNSKGDLLAWGTKDGIVRLWDISNHQWLEEPLTNSTRSKKRVSIHSLAFTPDDRWLIVGFSGYIQLWDTSTWQKVKSEFLAHQSSVRSDLSPDGKFLVTGGGDSIVKIWDMKVIDSTEKPSERIQFVGHAGSIQSIAFSPTSTEFATTGDDRKLKLWDLTGQGIVSIETDQLDIVESVAFTADGTHLATASKDGSMKLWRVGNLSDLIAWNCSWIHRYLRTNKFVDPEDRSLCDGEREMPLDR